MDAANVSWRFLLQIVLLCSISNSSFGVDDLSQMKQGTINNIDHNELKPIHEAQLLPAKYKNDQVGATIYRILLDDLVYKITKKSIDSNIRIKPLDSKSLVSRLKSKREGRRRKFSNSAITSSNSRLRHSDDVDGRSRTNRLFDEKRNNRLFDKSRNFNKNSRWNQRIGTYDDVIKLLTRADKSGDLAKLSPSSLSQLYDIMSDIDEMSLMIAAENPTTDDPQSLISLWQLLSGEEFGGLFSGVSDSTHDLIYGSDEPEPENSSNFLFRPVHIGPIVENLSPVVEQLEETGTSFYNLFTVGRVAQYLTGETKDSNPVSQFVQVLSPRNYEFPVSCNTSDAYTGRFPKGVCLRLADCAMFEGESFGTCGLGTGSCCVFHHSCGYMSNEYISHFTNHPGIGNAPGNGACLYTIEPRHHNTCQYRLDFIHFSIAGPNEDSRCEEDFIEVFGGSTVPKLCGDLTGQHLYVDVEAGSYIQLSVYTSSFVTMQREWTVRITQINCNSPDRVPSGCMQYHNETQGSITSFNYNPSIRGHGRMLANLQYGICVHPPSVGFCALLLQQLPGDSFSLSGNSSLPRYSMHGPTECGTDKLTVSGAIFRDASSRQLQPDSVFCGTKLPRVLTNRQPYVLRVTTDNNEYKDFGNRGFHLSYMQVKCNRKG